MTIPWHPGVRICHDANGWLAIDKPPGPQSHPNRDTAEERSNSVLDATWDAAAEAYRLSDGTRLWLCHRIDAPTSGLLLLARDPDRARVAREAFASGAVEKIYHAIVLGAVRLDPTLWTDRLCKDRAGTKGVRMRVDRNGVSAVTAVRSLRSTRVPYPLSLLELRPRTGRTHQLRVQAASRRRPILGDRTYGDFRQNRAIFARTQLRDRLYLHATSIRIDHPSADLPPLHAPPPADWPLAPKT